MFLFRQSLNPAQTTAPFQVAGVSGANLCVVSDRLGVEGLETAEGSGSDSSSSDDDSDEAPGTSGTSSPAPNKDSAGVESVGECSRSPGVLSTDCHSPEALPSPGAGSGDSLSDNPSAQRGDTAARERGERNGTADTETTQEKEEAQGRGPAEAAAAGPGPKRETETEVTDGAPAARAAPAEDGEGIPSTRPGDSQAGSSVSIQGRV